MKRRAIWLNKETILVKNVEIVKIHSYLKTQTFYIGMGWSESTADDFELSFHDNNLVDMLVGESNVVFIVRQKTKNLIEEVNIINNENEK